MMGMDSNGNSTLVDKDTMNKHLNKPNIFAPQTKTHQLTKWFTRQFSMINMDLHGNSTLIDMENMNKTHNAPTIFMFILIQDQRTQNPKTRSNPEPKQQPKQSRLRVNP